MKAAVFYEPHRLKLEEYPDPVIGEGEVLIAVDLCGICHTDISIIDGKYSARKELPMILGHELVGTVVTEGPEFKKGQKVMISPLISCGKCPNCLSGFDNLCDALKGLGFDRDGGFAEFISVPARNLEPLPEGLSFEEGVLTSCNLRETLRAVQRAQIEMGQTVAIFGATGIIGSIAVMLTSRLRGATVIAIGRSSDRLELVQELGGGPYVVNAQSCNPVSRIMELTNGHGADRVLEFVGVPAVYEQAVESCRPRGRVVIFGASRESFSVKAPRFFRQEVELTGAYGFSRNEMSIATGLVQSGKIDLGQLPTTTLSFTEISRALELSRQKKEKLMKVFLKMS